MTQIYTIDSPESQELLTEMRSLISDETKWTKGTNARDSQGFPVPILSPKAVSWDIMGALVRAKVGLAQPNFGAYHAVYEFLKSKIPQNYKNKDIEFVTDQMNWQEFADFLGVSTERIVRYVRATEDNSVRVSENGNVILIRETIVEQ